MGLYEEHLLPRLVHLACSGRPAERQRERVLPAARGRVLEIGVGSGLNLPFYEPDRVAGVVGIDPSRRLLSMASGRAASAPVAVRLLRAEGEAIPLATASVDTVVSTFTLCTIPDAVGALREMGRVLRPGGRLLFCEHGLAPDEGVRRWQDRLDGLWGRIAGGCHLNRDVPGLLRRAGFEVADLEADYIAGWRPASYTFRGTARAG
ncbi:MAG TPA: methyltransferase domain-containing protein [Gemmatimonadota bacterium]|nr:methyltransferase domain-containing protein [Gemmatimonadota bacterium]